MYSLCESMCNSGAYRGSCEHCTCMFKYLHTVIHLKQDGMINRTGLLILLFEEGSHSLSKIQSRQNLALLIVNKTSQT